MVIVGMILVFAVHWFGNSCKFQFSVCKAQGHHWYKGPVLDMHLKGFYRVSFDEKVWRIIHVVGSTHHLEINCYLIIKIIFNIIFSKEDWPLHYPIIMGYSVGLSRLGTFQVILCLNFVCYIRMVWIANLCLQEDNLPTQTIIMPSGYGLSWNF